MSEPGYNVTIKELPSDERPRERLKRLGPGALSIPELVAILLGMGYRNISALRLAEMLLRKHGGIVGLARADTDVLCREKGLGLAKACQLAAAFELGRRLAIAGERERMQLSNPDSAGELLMLRYGDRSQEHFGLLALDRKYRLLKETVVSVGTIDSTIAHPREIFRPAIATNAASVILFHNHPSGDPSPSEGDIEMTRRIIEAGKLIGIEVLDHIVVAQARFVSMSRQGLLGKTKKQEATPPPEPPAVPHRSTRPPSEPKTDEGTRGDPPQSGPDI